jgi:hypothetical protein
MDDGVVAAGTSVQGSQIFDEKSVQAGGRRAEVCRGGDRTAETETGLLRFARQDEKLFQNLLGFRLVLPAEF